MHQSDSSIPYIQDRGEGRTFLLVRGEPFPVLGGEIGNSTAADRAGLRKL